MINESGLPPPFKSVVACRPPGISRPPLLSGSCACLCLFGVPAVELSQSIEEKPMAVLEEQDRCELIFGPSVRFDFESGRTLVLSQGLQEQ